MVPLQQRNVCYVPKHVVCGVTAAIHNEPLEIHSMIARAAVQRLVG